MPKPVPISADVSPAGRLDILLLRLAEAGTRWAERRAFQALKVPLNLWDGETGVGVVLVQKLEELGVPRQKLTAQLLAERLGFVGKKPRKLRRTA